MWPAVKQMKEESYNMGVLAQTNKLVNMHLLTVEQAAMSLNLTVEEYLAEVEKVNISREKHQCSAEEHQ